ncbi:Pseudo ankyrin repeat-like [Cedratvirus A11]|uniref:Pseudo ankyrin repeat-like n=1 Tax=Cedratvirus A11 TaxID=1903266 RepID=A0A1M7XUY5_9VIRU|nr:Pseudo ankyrin repeat-like [Cedratvirus A11]SHO33505.1 Pseudo ankyrin repeat-like [Cedratvirus A11]
MNHIYSIIFSFFEGYNFRNRQVCSYFRQLAPKIGYCTYLNQLLQDGRKINFTPNQEIMQTALDNNLFFLLEVCKDYIPKYLCNVAAKKNNLELLQWAKSKGYEWDSWTYQHAMNNKNLQMVQWMRANGCPWNETVCGFAAQNSLEILKWIRSQGCPWHESTCANAAECGQIEILRWARSEGCEWDEYTCAGAATLVI